MLKILSSKGMGVVSVLARAVNGVHPPQCYCRNENGGYFTS